MAKAHDTSSPVEQQAELEHQRRSALEELAGLALSNRPRAQRAASAARVVLVADRFPVRGDPLVDFARTLEGVRVEAAAFWIWLSTKIHGASSATIPWICLYSAPRWARSLIFSAASISKSTCGFW